MPNRQALGPALTTVESVTELIGNTPMVRLSHQGQAQLAPIYVKLEQLNPSGSIRDRYIAEILQRSFEAGQMEPGDEVSIAGLDDSAVSAAFLGQRLGLGVHVFAPRASSRRLLALVERFGAKVIWTDADGGIHGAVHDASAWARQDVGRFYIEGFRRQAVRESYAGVSQEILLSLQGRPLGAFVSSVSTGGTFREVSRHLRETHPALLVAGAVLLDVNFAKLGAQPGDLLERVTMEDAWQQRDELARQEGLLLSPKGAACIVLAKKLRAQISPDQVIVVINPDAGQRYLGWEDKPLFSAQNPAHLTDFS